MIKIEDLIPLLKKGWVAMNKNGDWWWFQKKPKKGNEVWWRPDSYIDTFDAFTIKSAEDWTQSLIKIERKDK